MYEPSKETCQRMKKVISESKEYIEMLDWNQCSYSRKMLLTKLRYNMAELNRLCSMQPHQRNNRQRDFTLTELSKYTGKDDNPAYVAVNGTVYDVTNNAAWAAATHFGLTAGRDLSGEFASCHAGQDVLSKLPVVGKLI